MAGCGLHTSHGDVHATGVGWSFDSALDLAEFIAGFIGERKAADWYKTLTCADDGCPNKTPLQYQAGNLQVQVKVNPVWALWIVVVKRTWTGWFYCDGDGYDGDYPVPPVPEEYKGGKRPKANDP